MNDVNNYQPLIGFYYSLSGLKLIFKPGLKRFVIIPALINLLLYVGLFILLKHYMHLFNVWFESYLPPWLQWLGAILWLLFFIGIFLVFIYTFVTIANLIAAPFNSLLAQKVQTYLTEKSPPNQTYWDNIKNVPQSVGRQFGILLYYLPRAFLLFVLFFVPVVQTVAPFLWFLFNSWFVAMTYLDYPSENNHVDLRAMRTWLKQRRFSILGFGIGALCLTMIPIINFIAMPAAVAGATKFWVNANLKSNY